MSLSLGWYPVRRSCTCPPLEQHQGWNAQDAILHHDIGVLVGIELYDLHLSLPFLSQLFHDRVNHLAGLAPSSREINQYRTFCLQDFVLEVALGYIFNFAILPPQ